MSIKQFQNTVTTCTICPRTKFSFSPNHFLKIILHYQEEQQEKFSVCHGHERQEERSHTVALLKKVKPLLQLNMLCFLKISARIK